MVINSEATVIKNAGSHFLLSELPIWKPIPAVLKGKVRLNEGKSTNPIAVGDRVRFSAEVPDGEGLEAVTLENPALISEILDRKNYLIRKSTNLSKQSHIIAANIDMAYIVISLYFPEVQLPFVDRMLLSAGVYGIPAAIIMNKIDLYRDEAGQAIEDFYKIYSSAGYRVIETSTKTGEGIDEIRKDCNGKVCVFVGESGVGKSSIIKAIDDTLSPKIGKISEAHLQGKHTTSLYEMYKISTGGYIIDTPGLRGFGLVDLKKEEIALYFPEMLKYSEYCRFSPCTHTHEPGCAVKEALEEGKICSERYNSYLGMLEEDTKFR